MHSSALEHSAVCCSALQCAAIAVRCSVLQTEKSSGALFVLQHTATHCDTLQHTAAHRNTLQGTAAHPFSRPTTFGDTATRCNTLQHAATRCNTHSTGTTVHMAADFSVLQTKRDGNTPQQHSATTHSATTHYQHTPTHSNTLQHTPTHCNTERDGARRLLAPNDKVDAEKDGEDEAGVDQGGEERVLLPTVACKCCSVLQCVAVCCSVLQCVAE